MFQRLHQDTLFGRPIVSLPAFVIRKQHVMFSQAEEFIFEKVNSFVDGLEGGSTGRLSATINGHSRSPLIHIPRHERS